MLKENTQMEATSATVVVEIPIKNKAIDIVINPAVIGIRLSYFETSHPLNGSPASELMGIKSRIVPSWASLY